MIHGHQNSAMLFVNLSNSRPTLYRAAHPEAISPGRVQSPLTSPGLASLEESNRRSRVQRAILVETSPFRCPPRRSKPSIEPQARSPRTLELTPKRAASSALRSSRLSERTTAFERGRGRRSGGGRRGGFSPWS